MTKVNLRASGGLNTDMDVNNLPEGDYTIANNIIFDGGKDGGAGAIKMLDSIKSLGLTTISGTIKETFLNTDGIIYVLSYIDATTASIYKIVPTMSANPVTYGNPVQMLTYLHGAISTTFVPDLRVLGNTIVWNYAKEGGEEGIPLSFYIPTFSGTLLTPALSDLKLQKQTPNNVVTITKTLGTGIEFLESTDFQFASRYQYSSYEFSALGNYSQIYKGEKTTASYIIDYVFTGKPAYASYLELYVRIGNNGTWRRVDTVSTAATSQLIWTGQVYESLDIITTGKPFDAVPVSAGSIEVAKNRIFLANIQDEYNTVSTISTSSSSGYSFPSGTDVKTFKTGAVTTTGVTSTEGSSYVKPFANNSTYAIGVAFYDAAMKTRGVEAAYTKFTTGNFDYPIIPSITFGISGGAPSWAKYAQIVYSKNISKSYIFEGYASSIFFEITKTVVNELTKEVTTLKSFVQSVGKDDLKNITAFVIDVMGMIRAGRIYTWAEGDYAAIRTPNGVLTLKIIGQIDNLVYCAYSGAEMTNTTTVDPSTLPFEFYTPKQQQEDESLVFYEYGNLIPVTTGTTSITVNADSALNGSSSGSKLLGDMVFSTIEMPSYTTSPFTVDVSKGSPTVEDQITIVNSTHAFSTLQQSVTGSSGVYQEYKATPKSETPILTSLGTNNDGASIIDSTGAATSTGTSFKMTGYYILGQQESGVNKVTITYNLQATRTMTLQTPPSGSTYTGRVDWSVDAQVYRNPYNNTTSLYDKTPEKFGPVFTIGGPQFISTEIPSATTIDLISTQTIDFKSDLKDDINPNDAFYVVLTMNFASSGNIAGAVVTVAKNAGQTNSVIFNWNGDRTPVNLITSYNYNAPVSATKGKYLIRSISNATTNQYWNTSAGKPLLAASNIPASRRENTIRYGGNYVQGTKVNNVNSFFSLDSNDVAIENGAITSLQRATRLQGNGSMMLVLCQKESAYIMLGEQELSQGNNASIRALTANMIGTIRNFGNNLGMLDKKSVMNYKGVIWWWDDFNKKVVKYTPDGLETPSDTYMRSFFRTQAGVATFCYDSFHNMCFVSVGSNTQSMGYSDNLKRWIAAYDFVPNFCESFGDRMIAFKNGVVYRSLESNNKTDYNSFLGASAVDSNITFVINSILPVNPLNVAVWHSMNVTDYNQSNYVKSSLMTIGITNENGQSTSIVESNFLLEDNRLYAHIMRDVNTPNTTNPIITGNYMVGYQNAFQITMKDKTQNMRISSVDVEIAGVIGHS